MSEPTAVSDDGPRPLRVAFLGNFVPEHSTENHLRRAWENNGHHVAAIQEDDRAGWDRLIAQLAVGAVKPDLVMWTTTGSLAAKIPDEVQLSMLQVARNVGVPTVGYHLDRWWGLNRQHLIEERPWFRQSLVVTADGGHPQEWIDAGVNHFWMPPGVSRDEALREPSEGATKYQRFKVGWVGSWREYHPEWVEYRRALVNHLLDWYGDDLCIVEGGLRGQGLVDLYRTVPVIVGDSCLAPNAHGEPMDRYLSDRVPETMGRGGYLIHPYVACMDEIYVDPRYGYYGPARYVLGDWDGLRFRIELSLGSNPKQLALKAEDVQQCRELMLANHTYEVRLEQLVAEMQAREMFPEAMMP